jgi:glycosyltransferase involved in cell wall biosynthesis
MAGSQPTALVVAYNFPPHGAIGTLRTLRVVRQLHAAGWQVTVLAGDPASYVASAPVDQNLVAQIPTGVTVIHAGSIRWWDRLTGAAGGFLKGRPAPVRPASTAVSTTASSTAAGQRSTSGLVRAKDFVDALLSIPDREVGWVLPALARTFAHVRRHGTPDIIYSTAPPWTAQFIALILKIVLRRPWVADFRDPWSRAPWTEGRLPLAVRAAAVIERAVVRRADRIVFVAQGNRNEFAAHYGDAVTAKFEVVANGCDPSEFDALDRPPVGGDPFVLLHAGSLYGGRTPEPLLLAVASVIERGALDPGRFRLRFMGPNGLQSVDLGRRCRELGLESVVEFVGRVPRQESLRAMVSASSLLLLQPGHTVSVPGKLYEYLAAGRPILAIAEEGETADLVRASGIGVSTTPEDSEGIARGLIEVLRMGTAAVPPPPRATYDGFIGAARIERIMGDAVR